MWVKKERVREKTYSRFLKTKRTELSLPELKDLGHRGHGGKQVYGDWKGKNRALIVK